MNINSIWASLPPRVKGIAVVTGTALVGLGAIWYAVSDHTGPEERWKADTDQHFNVLTDNNQKNLGLDALAGRIRTLDAENARLKKQMESLENNQKKLGADDSLNREWQQRFDALTLEVNRLRAQQRDIRSAAPSSEQDKAEDGKDRIDDPFQVRERKRKELEEMKALEQSKPQNGQGASGQNAQGQQRGEAARQTGSLQQRRPLGTSIRINVVGEDEREKDKSQETLTQRAPAAKRGGRAYIPAGSILTGTLITGADFPTGKGSRDNPTPTLIRLSKQAILPNRYRSEVRECFMLVSGHGDLATERATLRSEMLSCIRNDGGIIQTKLNGYVAGEDGKAGMKGRLVSKTGQMIARTLVAGFLSGMSQAFDYDPVNVLDTSSVGNHTKYQSRWSTDAAKSGFAQGAHQSLERVADYYMDLADQMTPVVEVTAGRQVDLIVISGTYLDVTSGTQNSLPQGEQTQQPMQARTAAQ